MDINDISFKIVASVDPSIKAIDNLVTSLNKLTSSFDSVSAKTKSFQSDLSSLTNTFNEIKKSSTGVNSAFESISKSATSTKTAMSKSTEAVSKFQKNMATSTNGITNSVGAVGKSFNTTAKSTDGFLKKVYDIYRATGNASFSLWKLVRKISEVAFIILATKRAIESMSGAVQASMDYVEGLNLFMVALGENTFKAKEFTNQLATSLYLNESTLIKTQGLFYQVAESLGLSSDKSLILSENFTKLGYDIASLYNIKVEDAMDKLQAGLVGQAKPLRAIGIAITENNLKETARTLGITKSIEAMTEQEKIQLRYVTIMNQTTNAQGDMARTLSQPANMLRVLKDQFDILIRTIGNGFLPVLEKILPTVIGIVMQLTNMANAWAKARGYELPEITDKLGNSLTGVSDALDSASKSSKTFATNLAKVLKYTKDIDTATTGIDELNIMNDDTTTTDIDLSGFFASADSASKVIDLTMNGYDNMMQSASKTFSANIELAKKQVTEFTDFVKKLGNPIVEALKNAFKSFKTLFDINTNKSILEDISQIVTGIVNGFTSMLNIMINLKNNYIEPLLKLVAPKWLESIQDGSLAKAVETIFKLFMTYKVLVKVSELATNLSNISGILKGTKGVRNNGIFSSVVEKDTLDSVGNLWGLLAGIATAITTIQLGHKFVTGTNDDKKQVLTDFIGAVALGFAGFAITGNIVAGMLVYNLSAQLNITTRIKHLFENTELSEQDKKNLLTPNGLTGNDLFISTNNMIGDAIVSGIKTGWKTASKFIIDDLPVLLNKVFEVFKATFKIINASILKQFPLLKWIINVGSNIGEAVGDVGGQVLENSEITTNNAFYGTNNETKDIDFTPVTKNVEDLGKNIIDTADDWTDTIVTKSDDINKKLYEVLGDTKTYFTGKFKELILALGTKDDDDDPVPVKASIGAGNVPTYTPTKFANGGIPTKGSLFIAGEAGAELVGDLGQGGVSVVNKRQAKTLGIPMFANGINVPNAPTMTTPSVAKEPSALTANIDRVTDNITKLITKNLKSISNSKTFKTLSKNLNNVTKKTSSFTKTLTSSVDNFTSSLADTKLYKNIVLPVINLGKSLLDVKGTFTKIKNKFISIKNELEKSTLGKLFVKVSEALVQSLGIISTEAFTSYTDNQTIWDETGTDGGITNDQKDLGTDVGVSALSSVGTALGFPQAGTILSIMQYMSDGTALKFTKKLPTIMKSVMAGLGDLMQGVIDALPDILAEIPNLITSLVDMLTSDSTINAIINGLISIVNSIVVALPDIIMALVKAVPKVFMALIKAVIKLVPMLFKVGHNMGVSLAEGLANMVIAGVNGIISLVNKIPFVHIGKIADADFSSWYMTIPTYAEGGAVSQGQMFVAREAGAELVGNVGNTTAVMNNDQIVESVAKGVYDAVVSAMSTNKNSQTVVYLDGKKINSNQNTVASTRGIQFNKGF